MTMAGFGEPGLSTVDAAGLRLGVVATRWHADATPGAMPA